MTSPFDNRKLWLQKINPFVVILLFLTACIARPSLTSTHIPSPTATQPTSTPSASPTATQTPTPAALSPVNAPYLSRIANFGHGYAEVIAWSPDGKTFAVATSRSVDLYDAETLKQRVSLDTGQWSISLAYSPDSKRLALGSERGGIQVWDITQNHLLFTVQAHSDRLNALAFSPDGSKLFSGAEYDGTIRIWDTETGQMLDSIPGNGFSIRGLSVSPDGKFILADALGEVYVRDLSTRELLYQPLQIYSQAIFFGPDAKSFVTVGYKRTSNTNSTLETEASSQNYVFYWDTKTGTLLSEYPIGQEVIDLVTPSADRRWIAMSTAYAINIWSEESKKVSTSLHDSFDLLKSLTISPDGSRLLTLDWTTGGGDGSISAWNLEARKATETFGEYIGVLHDAAFSPDGKWAAAVGLDHKVQIWEMATGKLVQSFAGNSPLVFSPDSKILAYGKGSQGSQYEEYSNDYIYLHDLETGESLPKGVVLCSGAVSAAFSPDGQVVAYGGEHCPVTLREIKTGKTLTELDEAQSEDYADRFYIAGLTFSPDGQTLVVVGYHKIEFWDIQTKKLFNTLEDTNFEPGVAFSPDERFLAIISPDNYSQRQVQVWDVATNQVLFTLKTHLSEIVKLAFSPNGQLLAISGSADSENDHNVELWDAWTAQPIFRFGLLTNRVVGLQFSEDGTALAIAGDSSAIQVWDAHTAPAFVPTPRPTPTQFPLYTPTTTPILPSTGITKTGELGKGMTDSVLRSPDGQLIIVAQDDTLRWYDATTFKEVGSMPLKSDLGLSLVTASPNGQFVVVWMGMGTTVIDLQNQVDLGGVSGGNGFVSGFTFSPDSRYMACLVNDHSSRAWYHYISLFDTLEGKEVGYDPYIEGGYRFQTLLPDRNHTMTAPAISPDGKWVAAGHSDGRVYVWNLLTGETRFLLEGHVASVSGVDFSPNGRYLASGSNDGTVRLWNAQTGKLDRVITGFLDDVTGVKFSADGRGLIVDVRQQPTQSWDMNIERLQPYSRPLSTPDPFSVLKHQQGYTESGWGTSILFSPDGQTLALSGGNILLWDVATQNLITSLEWPENETAIGMAFSPDGTRLAAISDGGNIQVWDIDSGKSLFALASEILPAGQAYYATGSGLGTGIGLDSVGEQGLAFSPDGTQLVFANGPDIEVWDIQTASKTLALEQTQPPAYAGQVSFSTDGKRLYAVLNRNRRAAVWDAKTGDLLNEITLASLDPTAFTATALNGPLFARNNSDEQGNWIELWNLESGMMFRLDTPARETEPLRFSPDGSLLAAISNDLLHFWNTRTGQLVYSTPERFGAGAIAVSPDSKTLAVGIYGKAELWNIDFVRTLVEKNATTISTSSAPVPTSTAWVSEWPTPTPQPTPISDATAILPAGNSISSANAAQVGELNCFGAGTIEQVTWSADGQQVIVAGSQGVYQYNAATLAETGHLETDAWASSVTGLPDGRILAAGNHAGYVNVWNATSGKTLVGVEGSEQLALSADGNRLLYRDGEGQLLTYDLAAKQPLTVLNFYSGYARLPVFSPDGSLVAASASSPAPWETYSNDSVRIWDAQTGAIINALGGPDNVITGLSFSADGKFIVGAGGGSAWVWDVRPGTEPYTITLYQGTIDYNLNVYTQTVTAAALSPDNATLVVGDSEKAIGLYDRLSRKLQRKLEGATSAIRHLSFSPDGQTLLSVDDDGALLMWDMASGKLMASSYAHMGEIGGIVFRTDGDLAAWQDGTAWTIHPPDGALLHTTHIYSGTILASSPTGDWLATYYPYRISLWDAQSGEYQQTLEGEAENVYADYYPEGVVMRRFNGAVFNLDGSQLAAFGTGGIWTYDMADKKRVLFQTYGTNVVKLAFSPDNRWILASLFEQTQTPQIFDLQSGDASWSLPDHGELYMQYAFSPDLRWLGALSYRAYYGEEEPASFELWDASTHLLSKSLPFSKDMPLTSLVFSPDSRLAAVGQADGQIFLIDLDTLKVMATLRGHRSSVDHLAFSPDGLVLVSGSSDGTIRFWGVP